MSTTVLIECISWLIKVNNSFTVVHESLIFQIRNLHDTPS